MSNIINAIINLVTDPKLELREHTVGHNRANDMGKGLEEYIKDLEPVFTSPAHVFATIFCRCLR